MSHFAFRTPTEADLPELEATAALGVALYEPFAPPGWRPPPERLSLGGPSRWWLLAEADGAVCGHVAFAPASEHPKPDPDPELAHLGALFVRPRHHGTGVAAELLRRAGVEARARGFSRGRLYCAAGYERARRFYAREGWRPAGVPFAEPRYGGLELIELRRTCRDGG